MVITKEAARSVSFKLTDKKLKELNVLNAEISEVARNLVLKQIPKDVLELFSKKPNYFNKCSCVYLTGKGLNHQQVNIKEVPNTSVFSKTILVDDKNASTLSNLINKKETLKEDIKKLQLEIQSALLSLKTYNKITSEFKEAVPFLPFKEKNELVVNIKDIRAKL